MPTPTDLRAALRYACDVIDGGSAYCSDCDRGQRSDDELRALADAPPTVAELLPRVDAMHRLEWTDVDGDRCRATSPEPTPCGVGRVAIGIAWFDDRATEWNSRHLWASDLTQPGRLVEVVP